MERRTNTVDEDDAQTKAWERGREFERGLIDVSAGREERLFRGLLFLALSAVAWALLFTLLGAIRQLSDVVSMK